MAGPTPETPEDFHTDPQVLQRLWEQAIDDCNWSKSTDYETNLSVINTGNQPEATSAKKPEISSEDVGMFAIKSLKAWEAGKLTEKQTVKAAKKLVGRLQSLALANQISPPEDVIHELTEDAEIAAKDLLEIGVDIGSTSKELMHPDTAKRITRFLDYHHGSEERS